jgi:hypothetical protein
MDNKTKVEDVVAAAGKEAGAPVTLKAMSASSSAKASRRRKATSPPKSPRLPAPRRQAGRLSWGLGFGG